MAHIDRSEYENSDDYDSRQYFDYHPGDMNLDGSDAVSEESDNERERYVVSMLWHGHGVDL